MFERLADLAAEHAQLEKDLSDPSIHGDQDRARTLSRRYGELTPIVQAYAEWLSVTADEATARDGVIHADMCANCHPFYTGKQKILDTGGRVARFERQFGKKPAGQKPAAGK